MSEIYVWYKPELDETKLDFRAVFAGSPLSATVPGCVTYVEQGSCFVHIILQKAADIGTVVCAPY